MSYILDALRRAEAERERDRGAVPGVYAQPAVVNLTPARSRLHGPAWWGVAAGGLLGAAAVAALWFGGRATVTPPPVATLPTVAAAPGPATPAAVTAAGAAPVAPVVPAAPVTPNPSPLAVVSAPQAVPSPPPPPAASAVPSPAAKPAVAAESRPQPWGELSAEQKREWPSLSIGGSIYSDSASSRFVMINGQVVREGEAAAPGVTVERIGPKSAVLRWKDRRVELPF